MNERVNEVSNALVEQAIGWEESGLSPARQAVALSYEALLRIRENKAMVDRWKQQGPRLLKVDKKTGEEIYQTELQFWTDVERVNKAIREDTRLCATLARDAWAFTVTNRANDLPAEDPMEDPYLAALREDVDRKNANRKAARAKIKEVQAEVIG